MFFLIILFLYYTVILIYKLFKYKFDISLTIFKYNIYLPNSLKYTHL